ncbi:MAG: EamA family transporter [Firmicutes bacterium]|nr:EamA family transporter [Bacillota bacterium]
MAGDFRILRLRRRGEHRHRPGAAVRFGRTPFACLALWGGVRGVRPRDAAALLLLGGVVYAAVAGLYFYALKVVPVSLAVLSFYVYPALVCLLAAAAGQERLGRTKLTALAVATAGLVMVVGPGLKYQGAWYGVAAALGAALLYAVYLVMGTGLVRSVPPEWAATGVCTGAALSWLGIGLGTGSLDLDFSPGGWLAIAGASVVGTFLGVAWLFAALRRIGASQTAIAGSLEPTVAVALSGLLLGEHLTWWQVVGFWGILGGVGALALYGGGN